MRDKRAAWAFSQQVKTGPKLLLVYLALIGDKAGCSSPTEERLAVDCSMTTFTVYKHLRALEAKGLVERITPPGGRRTIRVKASA